ncbi:hypothetical protein ACMFMG_001004 [Clarireedia jacksonii]
MAPPTSLLQKRLLQDIHELLTSPYPHILLFPSSSSLRNACLHLQTPIYGPLHLSIIFPSAYPIQPPGITINSKISHPNVFDEYICASILNVPAEWTPAYTLKGVAIQLLSFFASERVEQVDAGEGDEGVELRGYRERTGRGEGWERENRRGYVCKKCGFGVEGVKELELEKADEVNMFAPEKDSAYPVDISITETCTNSLALPSIDMEIDALEMQDAGLKEGRGIQQMNLPNELILELCEYLPTENLMLFAKAWSRVGRIMTE